MRNIGIDVKKVKAQPGDKNDPFTAPIAVRGQQLVGVVVSTKAQRSATILMERQVLVKKYQRFIKKRSRVHVHNPDSISAQDGDVVRVMATRPISKTKHYVIIEILKKAGEAASAETGEAALDVAGVKEAQTAQRRSTKKKVSKESPVEEKTESKEK
jgi:small subunit ribosomal protein S17